MVRVRHYVCAKFSALQDALQTRLGAIDLHQAELCRAVQQQADRMAAAQSAVAELQVTVSKLLATHKAFWQWEEKFTEHLTSTDRAHQAAMRKLAGELREFARFRKDESAAIANKLGELDQRLMALEGLLLPDDAVVDRHRHPDGPMVAVLRERQRELAAHIAAPQRGRAAPSSTLTGSTHVADAPPVASPVPPTPVVRNLMEVSRLDDELAGGPQPAAVPSGSSSDGDPAEDWDDSESDDPRQRTILCQETAGRKGVVKDSHRNNSKRHQPSQVRNASVPATPPPKWSSGMETAAQRSASRDTPALLGAGRQSASQRSSLHSAPSTRYEGDLPRDAGDPDRGPRAWEDRPAAASVSGSQPSQRTATPDSRPACQQPSRSDWATPHTAQPPEVRRMRSVSTDSDPADDDSVGSPPDPNIRQPQVPQPDHRSVAGASQPPEYSVDRGPAVTPPEPNSGPASGHPPPTSLMERLRAERWGTPPPPPQAEATAQRGPVADDSEDEEEEEEEEDEEPEEEAPWPRPPASQPAALARFGASIAPRQDSEASEPDSGRVWPSGPAPGSAGGPTERSLTPEQVQYIREQQALYAPRSLRPLPEPISPTAGPRSATPHQPAEGRQRSGGASPLASPPYHPARRLSRSSEDRD
eukprot:EG_transcript_5087